MGPGGLVGINGGSLRVSVFSPRGLKIPRPPSQNLVVTSEERHHLLSQRPGGSRSARCSSDGRIATGDVYVEPLMTRATFLKRRSAE